MIYIDNRQNIIEVDEQFEKFIEEVISFTLKEEKVDFTSEVSVILVDNASIRELNREYRNIDKATDVLSFPILDFPPGKVYRDIYNGSELDQSYFDGDDLVIGDMAISLEKAQEQSVEYGHSFKRETAYLIVHSVLHLLGYDHMNDNEKELMREREEKILGKLGIQRL